MAEMSVENLAAEIQALLDNGWIPCGVCDGRAYGNRMRDASSVIPHSCENCENCGFIHPFLSFDEYREQIRGRMTS